MTIIFGIATTGRYLNGIKNTKYLIMTRSLQLVIIKNFEVSNIEFRSIFKGYNGGKRGW